MGILNKIKTKFDEKYDNNENYHSLSVILPYFKPYLKRTFLALGLAIPIGALDAVIALVLTGVVAVIATPFEFCAHVILACAVGGIHTHRALGIVESDVPIQFQNGKPGESDVTVNGTVTDGCGEREQFPALDMMECGRLTTGGGVSQEGKVAPSAVGQDCYSPVAAEQLPWHAAQPLVTGFVLHRFIVADANSLSRRQEWGTEDQHQQDNS